jgi:hypothetical protein
MSDLLQLAGPAAGSSDNARCLYGGGHLGWLPTDLRFSMYRGRQVNVPGITKAWLEPRYGQQTLAVSQFAKALFAQTC